MAKKKNWTMKAAAGLLGLVLVTSCFVGSTFAKYVTSGNGNDSARVAKFGVEITANGSTFAREYDTDDENVVGTIAQSVVSTTEKVIAPGTSGNMASATLSGTPEVAVKVESKATVDLGENWKDSEGNYYCPLEITVGDDTLKGTDYDSAAEFASAIKEKIDAFSANTDLSEAKTASAVSWKWAFEGNDDAKDTYLGDQAAKDKENAATISLNITTTVTQID